MRKEDFSEEDCARLKKEHADEVNDLNVRLEGIKNDWRKKLNEKLSQIKTRKRTEAESQPTSPEYLEERHDNKIVQSDVADSWLAQEKDFQVNLTKGLLYMLIKYLGKIVIRRSIKMCNAH